MIEINIIYFVMDKIKIQTNITKTKDATEKKFFYFFWNMISEIAYLIFSHNIDKISSLRVIAIFKVFIFFKNKILFF